MSLCGGIYYVVEAADNGEKGGKRIVIGGLFSLVVSAMGVFITYEIIKLLIEAN